MQEGRIRGQAFVTLPSEEVASVALEDTNGFLLYHRPMVVVSFTLCSRLKKKKSFRFSIFEKNSFYFCQKSFSARMLQK